MTPTEVKAYAKALSDKIGNSVPEPSDWDLLLKAVQEMDTAPLRLPSADALRDAFKHPNYGGVSLLRGNPNDVGSVYATLGEPPVHRDAEPTTEESAMNALRQHFNGGRR